MGQAFETKTSATIYSFSCLVKSVFFVSMCRKCSLVLDNLDYLYWVRKHWRLISYN